ncbi:MAG: hypothetical protein QOF79_3069 [Actinomycetota bacterium]|nr:hypothetical protein [Actinomycetota bacterium]
MSALIAGALFTTGIGATAANAVPATPTTLELHLVSSTGAPVTHGGILLFPFANGTLDLSDPDAFTEANLVPGKSATYLATLPGAGDYTAYLYGDGQPGTATQFLGGAVPPGGLENASLSGAPIDLEGAGILTVHAGANAANIGFAASGTISGTVRNSSGKGVRDACVTLYVFDGTDWVSGSNPYFCFYRTSSTGHYSINPGAAGSYKVEFTTENGAYLDQFSNGATSVDDAAPIYLSAGKSAIVNSTLKTAGKFSGTLLGAHSAPQKYVDVEAYRLTGNPTDGFTASAPVDVSDSSTNSLGRFVLGGLSTGYYAIGWDIFDENTWEETTGFIGGPDALHATAFAAVTGHTVALHNVQIGTPSSSAGKLNVTLTGPGGIPLPNEDVSGSIILISNSGLSGVEPDSSVGNVYTFVDVPAGDYSILVGDEQFQPVLQPVTIGSSTVDVSIELESQSALAFTTDPSLSDDAPIVGNPLTVDPGAVNHTTPDSVVRYQWYRSVNGSPIAIRGAKFATYIPRGADVGADLSVRVTSAYVLSLGGITAYEEDVSKQLSVGEVTQGVQIANTLAPWIANPDDAVVGATLVARAGNWSVPGVHFSYAWLRNGLEIPDATHATYTLTPEDLSQNISVAVSASRSGYANSDAVDSDTANVTVGAAPSVVKAPKITSTLSQGIRHFTVANGTWSLPGAVATYSWQVDGGVPTTGTSFDYSGTGAVLVTATASVDGHTDGSWTGVALRGATTPRGCELQVQERDNDSYSFAVSPVCAEPTFAVRSSAEVEHKQWQRLIRTRWTNFTPAGSGDPYLTTLADVGRKVRVVDTTTSPYYASDVSITPSFLAAAQTHLADDGSVSVSPTSVTWGATATATVSGFAVDRVAHKYQWQYSHAGGAWKNLSHATSSKLVVAAPVGTADSIRVVVTSTAPGFTAGVNISDPVTPVAAKQIHNVTLPSVSPGDIAAGSSATAVPGTWDIPSVTFTYQWSIDGSQVEGATGKTYPTSVADAGKSLTVAVTAHKSGYLASDAASSLDKTLNTPVDGASLTITPFTLGTVKYASTVTAPDPATVFGLPDGYSGYSTSYQWKLAGRSIVGATGVTFVPTLAEIGKTLSLTMTVTSDVYGKGTASSPAATIARADAVLLLPLVQASASPVVPGVILTATHAALPGVVPTYVWQSSTDGTTWTTLARATRSTFVVTAANAGASIRVIETAKVTGHVTAVETSDSTDVPSLGQISSRVDPTVGLPAVDVADTADVGIWNVSGLTFSYQWYLDDIAIPGATGATFTPMPSQATQDLSVRVSASRLGYQSASATSDDESIALGVAPAARTAPVVSGGSKACKAQTVSPGTWTVSGITETYQWTVGGSAVSGATSSTYTPTPAQDGQALGLNIHVQAIGHTPANVTLALPVITGSC